MNALKTIDPIKHIRSNPRMYLPYGRAGGPDLMAILLSEAIEVSEEAVVGERRGGWYMLASQYDWIAPVADGPIADYFRSMRPYPESGPNAMHWPVVVYAFAEDVMTKAQDGSLERIKGETPPSPELLDFVTTHTNWGRIVAFRAPAVSCEI